MSPEEGQQYMEETMPRMSGTNRGPVRQQLVLSASNPYLSIAKHYGIPYGTVLLYADALDLIDSVDTLEAWVGLLGVWHVRTINELGGGGAMSLEAAREIADLRVRLAVRA